MRKSPAHLLLLPLAFAFAAGCCIALVTASCAIGVALREEVTGLSSYGEHTKVFIVLPMLFASYPVGLIGANLVGWSIPVVRRFFEEEAEARPGAGFRRSMRGLGKLVKFSMLPLIAISVAASLFGS